jgi:hypothetical protein
MRALITCALTTLVLASAVQAAPACREKGKFVKCPPAAAAKPGRCKDARGKFAKCGLPGTRPV